MEMKLLGYNRSFDTPGAPIVWAIGVRFDFGDRKMVSVMQEEATDDELNVRAQGEGGKTGWDEDTLIAHTKEKHGVEGVIGFTVLPPRAVGPTE